MTGTEQESGLRIYSLGVVAADKKPGQDYIKVTPVEELPQVKGRLADAKFDQKAQGSDHRGVKISTQVKGVAYLTARWLNWENGNRSTSPDLVEGESVLLLKFGNDDDVYWVDIFREPKLRRLEDVIFGFSNQPKPGPEYDQKSSYWFQVSTRGKRIQLHTSNNDKEPVTYDLILDTKRGTFELVDSNKNRVFIDSVKGDMKVDMTRSIELNAPQIRINGKEYVRTTGAEISDKAKAKAEYLSAGTWQAQAGSTIEMLTRVTVNGTVVATGQITGAGINLTTHFHLYHDNGGPNAPSSSSQD